MKNHEKEKEINLLSCTLKVVVAKYPNKQWAMSGRYVSGRCKWEMSVGDVSGRSCPMSCPLSCPLSCP